MTTTNFKNNSVHLVTDMTIAITPAAKTTTTRATSVTAMKAWKTIFSLTFFLVTILISACGGGGGSSSGPSNPLPAQDTTAPSIPALNLTHISLNNVNNYSVELSSAEAGTTAKYSFTDGINTIVEGEAEVSSSSFTISGITLSALADGNINFQILLEDSAGNQSNPSRSALNKDTSAPDNYSVTTDITEINSTNEDSFSFTVTTNSDNIGTTLNYAISDQSGNQITGTNTVSSSSEQYSNIDISSLSEGTITLTIALTDDVGNIGDDASITINKTSPSTNVSLKGKVTFDFVPHNTVTNGLDYLSTTARPARNIEVQLLDASDSTLDTTYTDDLGDYQFSVAINTDVRVRVISSIKSPTSSPSWDFRVTDNTNGNSLYAMQGSLANTGVTNSIRDLHAPSGWDGTDYSDVRIAAPFAILDTIYTTLQLVVAADPAVNLPPAEIRWSENNNPASGAKEDGDIETSYYDTGEGNMYLLGAADIDTDEYDEHVIAHEWCHYLTDSLSRDESIGGPHGTSDILDPRVAMSEGFCNAIAGIALNNPIYRDSGGNKQSNGFSLDVEENDFSNKGWYSEVSAAAIIYDISDSTNDGIDNVSLGFQAIYDTMTSSNYLDADAFSSLHLFFDELKNQLSGSPPSTVTDINNLINFHEFIVNDELGTGETNHPGDGRVLPLYQSLTVGGSAETVCSFDTYGTSNKLGNIQYAIFSTPILNSYTITVSRVSGDTNSDPDFILWRNSSPIAISESETTDTESWSGGLSSDTYLLEIYDASNIFTEAGKDVCFTVEID